MPYASMATLSGRSIRRNSSSISACYSCDAGIVGTWLLTHMLSIPLNGINSGAETASEKLATLYSGRQPDPRFISTLLWFLSSKPSNTDQTSDSSSERGHGSFLRTLNLTSRSTAQ